MAAILSLIGITLDIIGAWLLFKHAFAADIAGFLHVLLKYITKKEQPEFEQIKIKARRDSKIAFGFLLVGFILQFMGSFIPMITVVDKHIDCKCYHSHHHCDSSKQPPIAYIKIQY